MSCTTSTKFVHKRKSSAACLWVRRYVVVAGILLALVLASGCGRRTATSPPSPVPSSTAIPTRAPTPTASPTPAGPLVIVGAGEGTDPDPFLPTGPLDRAISSALYDTLLHLDPADGHLVAGIASGWTMARDNRAITFTLPVRRRWSDGQPLDAGDVLFSLRQALAANGGAALGANLHQISNVEALDPQHIRINLKRGLCAVLYDIAAVPIVPRHVWVMQQGAGRDMIAGGAYAVRLPGQLQFVRNPNYLPAPAQFPTWDYRQVATPADMAQSLEQDTAHAAFWPPDEAVPPSPVLRLVTAPTRRLTSLAYRLNHPILRDPDVRRALAHAVDRKALVRMLYGQDAPLLRTHLPPGHWAATQSPPPPGYDPQEAARLLTGAGWTDHDGDGIRDRDGQPLRLALLSPLGSQQAEDIPLLLRRQLLPLGVDLQPQFAETLIFQDNLYHSQFDVALITWDVGLDPDQYDLWHSLGPDDEPAYNFVRYANPAVDRWLERARALPACDTEQRRVLYGHIWAALQQDQPYTFLFAWPQAMLVRNGLAGPAPNPFTPPLWNLATWRWAGG